MILGSTCAQWGQAFMKSHSNSYNQVTNYIFVQSGFGLESDIMKCFLIGQTNNTKGYLTGQSYLPCKMIMKEDNSPKYLQCVCIDQHWLLLLNYVLFSIHILTRLETPETFSSHSVKNL